MNVVRVGISQATHLAQLLRFIGMDSVNKLYYHRTNGDAVLITEARTLADHLSKLSDQLCVATSFTPPQVYHLRT